MSKLDELISVLCPDGVPYKYLSECCSLEKGKTPIQKAIPGEYPLVVTTAERKTSNDYQFMVQQYVFRLFRQGGMEWHA